MPAPSSSPVPAAANASRMLPEAVAALYLDGRSSRPQTVWLHLLWRHAGAGQVAWLVLHDDAGQVVRQQPLADVCISEVMGQAPRTLRFADGAFCEVGDLDALAAWLKAAQVRETLAVRLQARWHYAWLALLLIVAATAAGYLWGLPWLAKVSAPHIPARFTRLISETSLEGLDQHVLKASQLPPEKQAAIRQALQGLETRSGPLPAHRLFFRRAPGIGPNAFALPNGDVVIFDELVALSRNEQDVVAVLAHELGHVQYRHGLRQLLQGTVVAVMVGAWLGDVSSIAASLGTLVLQSNYSRDFEREADTYAGQHLIRAGLGVEPLVYMLSRLEKGAFPAKSPAPDKNAKNDPDHLPTSEADRKSGLGNLLVSHPETAERIRRLQQLAGQHP